VPEKDNSMNVLSVFDQIKNIIEYGMFQSYCAFFEAIISKQEELKGYNMDDF
jgi:hypothetical protein